MPLVSVIVPNFNHTRFLQQRMESILNQTFNDFEVILLDDCSTDNSREIIERYRENPKVSTIIYNEKNSGSTFKQWEKGIQHSSGEYIWIAESDDYCMDSFLEVLVTKLKNNKNAGIAYCQSASVDSDGVFLNNWIDHTKIFIPNIWQQSFYVDGLSAIKNFFLYSNIIPNASGVVFSKSFYDATSGFETGMKLNGDWFFWVKMLEKSDLIFCAATLNYFRQHQNKATIINTSNYNNLFEICQLYKYLKNNIGISTPQKSQMIKKVIRILVFQLKHEKIDVSLKNLARIMKALLQFESTFFLYIVPAAYEYLKHKIFFEINHQSTFSTHIDLSKITLQQNN